MMMRCASQSNDWVAGSDRRSAKTLSSLSSSRARYVTAGYVLRPNRGAGLQQANAVHSKNQVIAARFTHVPSAYQEFRRVYIRGTSARHSFKARMYCEGQEATFLRRAADRGGKNISQGESLPTPGTHYH